VYVTREVEDPPSPVHYIETDARYACVVGRIRINIKINSETFIEQVAFKHRNVKHIKRRVDMSAGENGKSRPFYIFEVASKNDA